MNDIRVLFTAAPGFIMWPNGSAQVDTSVPPVALYTLGAVVEQAGFPCTILDPVEYWRLCRDSSQLRQLAAAHPVFCLSANSNTWPAARVLLDKVAAVEPRPVIVVGGLHATYCDEHVMRTTPVDIIVRGEGEIALREVLQHLARDSALDDIGGLTFRRDGRLVRTPDREPLSEAQLSATPLPLWERLPGMVYGFIPVEVSRGCRFGCTFCSIYFKHHWRPAEHRCVCDRIEHAVANLGRVQHRALLFSDDCFTTDSDRVALVAEILAAAAPGVGVGVEARAGDVLQPATLAGLARMQIEFIQIGVECGYPEGLRKVHKGINLEQVIASTHALHRLGIHAAAKYSYIIGFPWETREDMMRTMAFAMSLGSRYGNHVQVNWHLLFPGSELYAEFRRAGQVSDADYDALPHEQPEVFFRTHPSVDARTPRILEDYAVMLEHSFPWVGALGNIFRSWTQHVHLPWDRTLPAAGRKKTAGGCVPSPVAVAARNAGGWWPLPPVLQTEPVGDA